MDLKFVKLRSRAKMRYTDAMKIAILGYGVEGQALAQYFGRRKADITICDENDHVIIPEKYNAKLGANAFKKLRGFDMVFRSPGIRT